MQLFGSLALIALVGIASARALVLPKGDVPVCTIQVPPQPAFNGSAFYTGRWYVSGATPRPTPGTSCAYYQITNGTAPLVFKQHIKILGKDVDTEGHITPNVTDGGATAIARDETLGIDLTLTIVDTDYDNYAIAVACAKKAIVTLQQAFVMSRSPTKPANLEDLKEKIHNLGFATNAVVWGEITNDCVDYV